MRLSHDPGKTHASSDDPNLVSRVGLVAGLAPAEPAIEAKTLIEQLTRVHHSVMLKFN